MTISFDNTLYRLRPDDRDELARAEATLELLRGLRVAALRASDFSGLASFGLASYLQHCLHRVVHLAEGVASEWNASRPLNAAVLLRSLTETVAGFHHVLDCGEPEIRAADLRAFHDRVVKGIYGSRQMRLSHPEMPEATNVLTLIDRLDKKFAGLRRYYDALCELTHPNADGMTLFGEVDHEQMAIAFSDSHESASFVVEQILAGLSMLNVTVACLQRCREVAPCVAGLEAKYGRSPDKWPKANKAT